MPAFLFKTMETPPAYGWFHLSFFALIIVAAVLLLVFFRKCNDKTFRIIVGIAWGIIIILEIGKQLTWNYDYTNKVWRSYEWSSFPYQFCSLPFYMWPLVMFLPESKYKDAINVFLGTFVFFAGFGYLFVPASLCQYVFINHQTMLHHGIQCIICLFIFVHEYNKFTLKKFLQGSIFLVFSVALAIVLNVWFSNYGSLNLFELNPIQPTQAALFGDILKATNYPVFVMIYLIGFFTFAIMTFFALKYIIILTRYIKAKINKNHCAA